MKTFWIAQDKSGDYFLHLTKPVRNHLHFWQSEDGNDFGIAISEDVVEALTNTTVDWMDVEPVEITVTVNT